MSESFTCPACRKQTARDPDRGFAHLVDCRNCNHRFSVPSPPLTWAESAKMAAITAGVVILAVAVVWVVWLGATKDRTPVKREPRNWQELDRDLREMDRNGPKWERGVGGRVNN